MRPSQKTVGGILRHLGYPPSAWTVGALVHATGLSGSVIRQALGELYGAGLVRISTLSDEGEPIWIRASADEREQL